MLQPKIEISVPELEQEIETLKKDLEFKEQLIKYVRGKSHVNGKSVVTDHHTPPVKKKKGTKKAVKKSSGVNTVDFILTLVKKGEINTGGITQAYYDKVGNKSVDAMNRVNNAIHRLKKAGRIANSNEKGANWHFMK